MVALKAGRRSNTAHRAARAPFLFLFPLAKACSHRKPFPQHIHRGRLTVECFTSQERHLASLWAHLAAQIDVSQHSGNPQHTYGGAPLWFEYCIRIRSLVRGRSCWSLGIFIYLYIIYIKKKEIEREIEKEIQVAHPFNRSQTSSLPLHQEQR